MRLRALATPRVATAALGLAVLLVAATTSVSWLADGGRWLRMDTPSMGTTAPVGSLLWVRPVPLSELEVGDVVTIRPEEAGGRTYTHEVASTRPGGIRTRGVLSGEDPWVVEGPELVGRVERTWPVVGTLVTVSPLLVALLAATFLLATRVREHWRLPVQILGVSVALSAVLVVHRPLTDARMLSFDAGAEQARTTWVNAGQVPLRLRAPSTGASATMGPGETASIAVTRVDGLGRYGVTVRPDLPFWTYWLVGGVWVVPALGSTLRQRRAGPTRTPA